jgi:hypothetical protein
MERVLADIDADYVGDRTIMLAGHDVLLLFAVPRQLASLARSAVHSINGLRACRDSPNGRCGTSVAFGSATLILAARITLPQLLGPFGDEPAEAGGGTWKHHAPQVVKPGRIQEGAPGPVRVNSSMTALPGNAYATSRTP